MKGPARTEQYVFSTAMLLLSVLSVVKSPLPSFEVTPSFLKFACAGCAFLLSATSCSPASDKALLYGAAGFTLVVSWAMYAAGFFLARPGVGIELLCLASGVVLTVGAATAPSAGPVKTQSALD